MKFTKGIPVKEIAQKYNCEIIGDENFVATGLNEIHKVEYGDITFVDIEKYYHRSLNSNATVIIINKKVECPEGKVLLFHENPFSVYNDLALSQHPFVPFLGPIPDYSQSYPNVIIEPLAIIVPGAQIGAGSYIQAGAYVGASCIIGRNVIIQANAMIGTDAFYMKKQEDGSYIKWNSCGRVIIGDDVVIGAGCTINRGVSGDTVVGEGSKLDSQVHVGHGAVIGKNCLFAAQVGIGGKTIIGDNVAVYGQVGIAQSLHIPDDVTILAKSGVSKDLEKGKTYFGIPAQEVGQAFKEMATLRMLTKEK